MEEENINIFNIQLEYATDENILKNDLFDFINLIDDSLFAMSSFDMSDTLNENYDFLTTFAISLILNNEINYNDKIVYGNEYIYEDSYGNVYSTDKYVSLDVLYDITNNVFGKSNYVIINDYLNVEDNLIPLLLIKDNVSFMEIQEIIDVTVFANQLSVYVKYRDIDYEYIYSFLNKDGRLILVNLDVEA